jgi:hypothetical protein
MRLLTPARVAVLVAKKTERAQDARADVERMSVARCAVTVLWERGVFAFAAGTI